MEKPLVYRTRHFLLVSKLSLGILSSDACEKQTCFILMLPVAGTVGMQNIYLFLCFLQLKKEATSSSTMPSVVRVVGVAYTPSCTKGKEVNKFFNSQFQFICCCDHTFHTKY